MWNRSKKDEPAAPGKLYSKTLDGELEGLVCAITPDDGCRSFRSDAFAVNESQTVWLEAWRIPGSPLWRVERHERLTLPSGVTNSSKPDLRAACFFDALYRAAFFEKTENALKEKIPYPRADKTPHYSAVAAAENIPFDELDLPLPAANGRILVPGDYNDAALAVAGQTKNLTPATFAQADAAKALLDGLMSDDVSQDDDPVQKRISATKKEKERKEKRGIISLPFNKAAKFLDRVQEALNNAVDRGFVSGWSYKGATTYGEEQDRLSGAAYLPVFLLCSAIAVLSGGLFVYAAENERKNSFPVTLFNHRCAKLKSCAKKLPDDQQEIKTMLDDFGNAARGAFLLEKIGLMYRESEGGKKSERTFRKGGTLVHEAARQFGLSEAEGDSLLHAYADGKFPEKKYFVQKLDARRVTLRQKINQARDAATL